MSPNQLGFGRGGVYHLYAKPITRLFPDCRESSPLLLQTMIREWETQESSKTLCGILPVQLVSHGAKGVMQYYNHLLSKAVIPVAPGYHSPPSSWQQRVTMVSGWPAGDGAQGGGGKSASSTKRPLNCGDLHCYAVWCSVQKEFPL